MNYSDISKQKNKGSRSVRKILVSRLDTLFSLYIRRQNAVKFGGICAICSTNPATQCFHILTRAKYSVRWDESNAWASCGGCNIRYEHDQSFMYRVFELYKKRNGMSAFDELILRGNKIAKFSNSDLQKILEGLKKKVEAKTKDGIGD